MECQFGIRSVHKAVTTDSCGLIARANGRGNGYVLLASDMTMARSIVKMKNSEDKMAVISQHQVMAYNGEPGAL